MVSYGRKRQKNKQIVACRDIGIKIGAIRKAIMSEGKTCWPPDDLYPDKYKGLDRAQMIAKQATEPAEDSFWSDEAR
jgi:hypothetical protein